MTMRFSRRAFLCILGALGPLKALVAGRGRRVGADAVSLAEFVALSERLTGHRSLDRSTARTYLEALLDVPADRELLADLAHRQRTGGALMSPAHAALEERVIASWYTGVHEVNGADRSADYAGALMWTALNRPAFGFCAGETGSWSRAPE